MYSLLLDTHDAIVTIILYKDGKVLDEKHEVSQNQHSVLTFPLIVKILDSYKLKPQDLGEIIVVPGPGSFTGERIAVTIAKTLSYTLDIPIKTIDALLVMALNILEKDKCVAILDRNGAFVGVFDEFNNLVQDYAYYSKLEYQKLLEEKNIVTDVLIDYEVVYNYLKDKPSMKAHEVKPLYVKGIKVLNDK